MEGGRRAAGGRPPFPFFLRPWLPRSAFGSWPSTFGTVSACCCSLKAAKPNLGGRENGAPRSRAAPAAGGRDSSRERCAAGGAPRRATAATAAAAPAAAAAARAAAPTAAGDLVSTATYTCDPSTCLPPACMCAVNNPPGGLSAAQIPQFILVCVAGTNMSIMLAFERSFANILTLTSPPLLA